MEFLLVDVVYILSISSFDSFSVHGIAFHFDDFDSKPFLFVQSTRSPLKWDFSRSCIYFIETMNIQCINNDLTHRLCWASSHIARVSYVMFDVFGPMPIWWLGQPTFVDIFCKLISETFCLRKKETPRKPIWFRLWDCLKLPSNRHLNRFELITWSNVIDSRSN